MKTQTRKTIFIFIILMFNLISFGQEYHIKKMYSPEFGMFKIKDSKIIVEDGFISIIIDNQISKFDVDRLGNSEFPQYKTKSYYTEFQIRITHINNKLGNYFTYEMKDNFTGKITNITYYVD